MSVGIEGHSGLLGVRWRTSPPLNPEGSTTRRGEAGGTHRSPPSLPSQPWAAGRDLDAADDDDVPHLPLQHAGQHRLGARGGGARRAGPVTRGRVGLTSRVGTLYPWKSVVRLVFSFVCGGGKGFFSTVLLKARGLRFRRCSDLSTSQLRRGRKWSKMQREALEPDAKESVCKKLISTMVNNSDVHCILGNQTRGRKTSLPPPLCGSEKRGAEEVDLHDLPHGGRGHVL